MDGGFQMEKIKVFLLDQHPLLLMSLNLLLNGQEDMKVCGESNDTRQTLQLLQKIDADVVLLGLSFNNGPGGLEFLKDVRVHHPRIRSIVLSSHLEHSYAERAMKAGALGYICKSEPPEEVLLAIRTVHSEGVYLSKNILNQVVRQFASGVLANGGSAIQKLADRELEVFELIGQGKSTKEIASILRLDIKTIETYRVRVKKKLGFRNATELHQRALKWMENKSE